MTSDAFFWLGEPIQFGAKWPPHPNWFTDLMERIKVLEYLMFHVETREPGQQSGICVALFDF